MKHRWHFTGRSPTRHIINAHTGEEGPLTYTVGFICTTCGIHWNSWAHFIDGEWRKSKETNHGELVRPNYVSVVGKECDPFWMMRFIGASDES